MRTVFFSVMLVVVFALSGCSNNISIVAKFTQPQNIESGDPVEFNGQVVGEVDDVNTDESGSVITLALDADKVTKLTTSSAAIVLQQPEPHVNLYSNESGSAIESGMEVLGLNNTIDLATWSAGSALGALEGLFNSAAGAFNQFLNNNNWDDVAKQLNKTFEGMSEQSTDALQQLGGEMEKFLKNMHDQSSETLKQANKLSKQLNQELQKYKAEGKDELAKTLQQLLDAFNSALESTVNDPPSAQMGEPL